ncbi:hypothetical protein BaRGS_00031942 [Batillaria attramentaria]|uniref:Transmembrane protein n=1 Tax=Batillaria attramentaria TaxID=370345 RepID=A0ABD0JQ56_9CAEN
MSHFFQQHSLLTKSISRLTQAPADPERTDDWLDNTSNKLFTNDAGTDPSATERLDSLESSTEEKADISEKSPNTENSTNTDKSSNTDVYMAMLGIAFAVAASLGVGVFVYYRFCKVNQGELVEEGDDVVMIVNTLYQGQQPVSRVASLAGNEYEEIAAPGQALGMDVSSRPPAPVPKHASNSLKERGLIGKVASLRRLIGTKKHESQKDEEADKPTAAPGDYVSVSELVGLSTQVIKQENGEN